MARVLRVARAVWVTALLVPGSALAHHSYAMFEVNKTITLTGTVKSWQWTNPHTWLVMVAQDARHKDVEWQVEGSSPTILHKYGATRDLIKAGDRITVVIHPLKSGANGGQLQSITNADGKTIDLADAPQSEAPPP
jgi:hypothetical protein